MHRCIFPIWGQERPFAVPEDAVDKEHFKESTDGNERITDVSEPTLSFFPASGPGVHPALLICPGGGYSHLSWLVEGLDIAGLANLAGISAFVLKYRCPQRREAAHADAARAMRLIRHRAQEFTICPEKVGAIGFSAGAHLAATISAPANPVPYPAIDAADECSFRPNFLALIYPAYLADDQLKLAPEFRIDEATPQTFLVQSENDSVRVENSLAWYWELKKHQIPAEMHLYPDGGHGYGLLRTGSAASAWGEATSAWLKRINGIPR
ncbi:MAG: alpha/beta hydrolase [Lentisphaerae bacterium]|nr:alpha/beta hydrolase [Lentisphaerota bacterium]